MLPKGLFGRIAGVDATELRCKTFLIACVDDESARYDERAEFSESMEHDSRHFVSITVAVDVNGISVHQTGPEQWKAKIAENRAIKVT